MDPRLLGYYNQELKFIREMGAEFADAYPRIAARLGLEGDAECSDPYVERLLEGFAFLAARTQLKLEARHPEFTEHLLEMIYPGFLAPVPSCAIAQLVPDMKDSGLVTGLRIPRGTALRPPLLKGEQTACEFRTAQEVTLWPLTVTEARYFAGAGALSTLGVNAPAARAAIRLRLKTAGGASLDALPLERLVFFIKAVPDIAARIHEQVHANALGLVLRAGAAQSQRALPAHTIKPVGFGDQEALLPPTRRSFAGYRLLQEYFALPEKFLFFALTEISGALRTLKGQECELFILLDRAQSALENQLEAGQFRLGCAPIINLFPRSVDRLHVGPFDTEHHVVVDRNRPLDFEVFSLESVSGVGASGDASIPLQPFYGIDHGAGPETQLYYTQRRRPRLLSAAQQQGRARSNYVGTECYVSITGPGADAIVQLDARAWCTNRDLPIQLGAGTRGDLLIEGGGAVESVRCITGPTYPRASPAFGDTTWKLISHLALNHLSLLDGRAGEGGGLLRDLLSLYADPANPATRRQIEGVRSIGYERVVRRLPLPGPISHGRGLRITLDLDEAAFEGAGVFTLASVLDHFFAAYVSINSFTQTRVVSASRGEIKEWPPRLGQRPLM